MVDMRREESIFPVSHSPKGRLLDELTGTVSIVTGAVGGLGRSISQHLIRNGSRVVIADIDADKAVWVADQFGPNAVACQVDVTDEHAVQRMVSTTLKSFGRIDALVNNAAITGSSSLPLGGRFSISPLISGVGCWTSILTGRLFAPNMLGRR